MMIMIAIITIFIIIMMIIITTTTTTTTTTVDGSQKPVRSYSMYDHICTDFLCLILLFNRHITTIFASALL